jgi:enolase
MSTIVNVWAREILDSRGNPTVEVEVTTDSGAKGVAAVPSGASTGTREALELRDGDPARYGGKGVQKAVENVNGEIAENVVASTCCARSPWTTPSSTSTAPKASRAWAPTPCSACPWPPPAPGRSSWACPCTATWAAYNAKVLPAPLMNIVNGGAHAPNNLDIQEFMIVPLGATHLRRGPAHGRRNLP